MKILQISPQVPYPPDDGGKVGIFNITKHLALAGHEVTLFALDRSPGTDYGPLREYCALHTLAHPTGNRVPGALLNLFSDLPYNISKYRSREFLKLLMNFTRDHGVDVIHVDHLHMAEYGVALRDRNGLPAVLREHNVESVIMERFADHTTSPLVRAYARLQQGRLRRYESKMAGLFDSCCPITPDDADRLRALNPAARIRVVPGGVEAPYFGQPDDDAILPDSIVFFGGMDWLPNADAVLWFLEEIFPLIRREKPGATFTIVGKNVPEEISGHPGPGFLIRGYVEDLRSEIQKHAVSIAPFRIGGGMRLKIIESFAMRVPVVSTPVGCEGIGAKHGDHLVVAGSAGDFASQVVDLLGDADRRNDLRANAYAFASREYRWENVVSLLEVAYAEAISGGENRVG